MRAKPSSPTFLLSLFALFFGMTATHAYAYLDAGTGSMILQVILGGVAGALIAGKLYWHKFLTTIGVRREEADGPESRHPPQGKHPR